ncbi:nucleotidyltransferase domain-containing protein [Paenibacillus sepulcri]|uniref:Nucleotidyltransferase domain-containing protein n=1 Tax=Paenibacillus sepulcri TaxID=359917 RepID=A0ABS7C5Y9_9BACL|nr:nucleotidyltransferase domain-containing protein [Paenibacillus sepulcri]
MTGYQAQIMEQLRLIEQEEGVRILYACESGSRAWGFASKDSDYDVRFIYVRPIDDYLSIFNRRDVIERPISGMLDINGWDMKKALNLFRKSNPPLLEWLQSPITYMENGAAAEQIRRLSPLTFSPRSCMHHYLHMAKGNYRDYLQGEQVKIKKYFYVLRPILACEWIERRNTMPPIQFEALVETLVPGGSGLKMAIDRLLVRKKAGDELDIEARIDPLNAYLEERIAYYEGLASSTPVSEGATNSQLDELFRAALRQAWE